jgi:hypothetical protein
VTRKRTTPVAGENVMKLTYVVSIAVVSFAGMVGCGSAGPEPEPDPQPTGTEIPVEQGSTNVHTDSFPTCKPPQCLTCQVQMDGRLKICWCQACE